MTEFNRTHFFVFWFGLIVGGAILSFLEVFDLAGFFVMVYLTIGFIGITFIIFKDKFNEKKNEK